jgi:hypothetical protein
VIQRDQGNKNRKKRTVHACQDTYVRIGSGFPALGPAGVCSAGLLGGVGGWSVGSTLAVLGSGGYRGELTDSSAASRRFSGLSSTGNGCGTLCRRPSQVTAGPTRESRLASFSALVILCPSGFDTGWSSQCCLPLWCHFINKSLRPFLLSAPWPSLPPHTLLSLS